ncbi:unnamed protein product [Candida verbasci]|uniref:Uncharacterized protein n=1 Tax=Candida verbasci TaxID=1227364 RepID=A0A9W4TS21_9ASCO|nr:unnamed protein product [Candida verbasci]
MNENQETTTDKTTNPTPNGKCTWKLALAYSFNALVFGSMFTVLIVANLIGIQGHGKIWPIVVGGAISAALMMCNILIYPVIFIIYKVINEKKWNNRYWIPIGVLFVDLHLLVPLYPVVNDIVFNDPLPLWWFIYHVITIFSILYQYRKAKIAEGEAKEVEKNEEGTKEEKEALIEV